MKIKVTREIKICVHPYKVEFNPDLHHEEGLRGCANHLKQFIQIDPKLPPSHKLTTFLHEVNHIISDQYSLGLNEETIDGMAHGQAELMEQLGIELDWSEIECI